MMFWRWAVGGIRNDSQNGTIAQNQQQSAMMRNEPVNTRLFNHGSHIVQ